MEFGEVFRWDWVRSDGEGWLDCGEMGERLLIGC